MIILPDKNICRTKFLVHVPKKEWMPSSQAIPKDDFGNCGIRTFFRVNARINDGFIVWSGVFQDRNDFDAFLFSLFTGSLKYEKELWSLCSPYWSTDIGEHVVYDFATEVALTGSPGTTQTYTSPSDWNNSSNSIECLGGGGGGGASRSSNSCRVTGGGGGGYAKDTNFSFATPGTTTASYNIGIAGTPGTTVAINTNAAGSAGGGTWFSAAASLQGGGGGGGGAIISGTSALNGGTAGAGSGTLAVTTYSGGRGGNISAVSTTNYIGTGAGGAAGTNGAGIQGGDASSAVATNGGNGDNNTGGTGGTALTVTNGTAGTEWGTTATYGSGGGGGARFGNASVSGDGSGGLYGGGGGGACRGASNITAGSGKQGLLYITYTPSTFRSMYNSPMLGM